MARTAVLYAPRCLEHDPGPDHPESPGRLRVVMGELNRSPLVKARRCSIIEPEPARSENLELVHQREYIQLVEELCRKGGGVLDLGDTVVSRGSFEAALYAVGGALKAVDLVMDGKFRNAFAVVRPPGHHAGPYYACGFCVFNNVAIAASHLLCDYNLKRVLILDVDAHHGNGTQEIFYETDKVLYISLHQDPRGFPGTGFADEVGEKEGLGYSVNVPFPFHVDDQAYLRGFNRVVVPIVEQYKPQFVLMSVGFDCHHEDPVARLSLSAHAYVEVVKKTLELASKLCDGKLVAVLEGGYGLSSIGKIATAVIARMAGTSYPVEDRRPAASRRVRREAEKVLAEVMSLQSAYWSLK